MEGNIFTILLDYYGENEVSLILWSTIKPTSTMLKKVVLVSECLAIKIDINKIFIQTWSKYENILKHLGYKIIDKDDIWLSKNIM